jgi:hypothetical protein
MLDKLKDKALEIHASVSEKIADSTDASMEKLQDMMTEVNEISPVINELGYTVDSINVEVGLMPSISLDISGMTKTIPEETYNRILEEHKDRNILINVIKTLQNASVLQNKVHILGMLSDHITIALGLPPKMILKFKKTE